MRDPWSVTLMAGSSPLARGSRADHHPGTRPGGIIPARAGFTGAPGGPGGVHADHPRSRGVHPVTESGNLNVAGSSPLARGSLGHHRPRHGHPGIIPARAGFTAAWVPLVDVFADHPRSRGVHSIIPLGAATIFGSSPLARGSRRLVGCWIVCWRIIPARAGFTSPPCRPPGPAPDHPRSRGVH